MRFSVLRGIGHDVAHSLASGASALTGLWGYDPFAVARCSPGGFIAVDFLEGVVCGGRAEREFVAAVGTFRDALPALCARCGVSPGAFARLTARYADAVDGGVFSVTVGSVDGRSVVDQYDRWQYDRWGGRLRMLGASGRRRMRGRVAVPAVVG